MQPRGFRCCCFRTVRRQPAVERLHHRAHDPRELRLCGRRAVPRRSAVHPRADLEVVRRRLLSDHALRDYLAMQAVRPITLSATVDLLLAHPQWRDRIDPSRIGGFGASMGGESIMLMAGAGLTTSLGFRGPRSRRILGSRRASPTYRTSGSRSFRRSAAISGGSRGSRCRFSRSAAPPTRARRSR